MKSCIALLRSSFGIPFNPGASVGTGDTPSIGIIPAWVLVALPLRYLALVAGTRNSRTNNEEVMVMMAINLLTAILLYLSQDNFEKERIETAKREQEEENPLKTP